MAKWLKRIIPPLALLCVIGAIIAIMLSYSGFLSAQIRTDSQKSMEEIYGQVNRTFGSFLDRNWGLLDSYNDYLALSQESGDENFTEYIAEKKASWGFSEFYFLDSDKNYRTPGGAEGFLRLENASETLITEKKPIMASETIDGTRVTMFAIAADGEYHGFPYQAISISYTNTAIAGTLNANAFEGEGKCYIITPDGNVLLSMQVGGGAMGNYFEYLSDWLTDETLDAVANDIKNHKNGFYQGEIGGEERSIIYLSIGYEDYALLGDVPQTALNKGFLLAQRITTRVLLIIFSIVVLTLIALLVYYIINQSRQTKHQLQAQNLLFNVLSNNINDIFLMLEPKAHKAHKVEVDYISPNVERLLGIKLKDAREDLHVMAACVVNENIVIPADELREIPLNGSKSWECEYMHQRTGERRWYRVEIYRMSIHKAEKYIIVMSDRTLDRQLNQKLQEALDAAKSANEAKSNFLSNMSHDIRTPMNAIVGFSALLERNASDIDLVHDYTRKIMASSRHLLSLINDVLDMSKIESGKTSLNIGNFNLPSLLEDLNIIIMPQAKAKSQTFTIHTQGTPPDEIMGDKLRLNQILLNLLSNAVKYTQVGGEIEFTVQSLPSAADQYAKLRFIVRDNGIGMSEEFVKEIFQPFSREKNSIVDNIQGTGLGMAITKNLVDLMGGIIRVESEPGAGSTFTVELSFALAQAEQDEWYRGKIARILVADDEEEICLGIREMMRGTGVEVSYATSGAGAVETAVRANRENADFQVILLDWKMPGMDGVETAREIRKELGTDIPILVLTSYDWSEIETEARRAGIDSFMPKPFFASSFFRIIRPLFTGIQKQERESPDEHALEGKLFLVAEDNELNAEILTEMLNIEGASCDIAANGKTAVEMFEASEPGHYDMVLMDVQMPIMNGYEATQAIRASSHPDAKNIPIVAMTANTFAEDVKRALDAGMNGHLAKPIDMDAVRRTVANLLNHKQDKGEAE